MAHKEYVRKYGGGNSREREDVRAAECTNSLGTIPHCRAMRLYHAAAPSQLWPL